MTDKTNKTEMGMNRNAFYEYKKNRVLELVQQGASVSEMANAIGMGEKDMYAFLSRNFGGFRRLKQMASSGKGFATLKMASMTTETASKEAKTSKKSNSKTIGKANSKANSKTNSKTNGNSKTQKKGTNKKSNQPISVLGDLSMVLDKEKAKLLSDFKKSIETESHAIIVEAQKNLVKARDELINGFRNEIVTGLSVSFKK